MTRDGVNPDVLDMDPNDPAPSDDAPEDDGDGVPIGDDPKYAKYFKMLKMGLPPPAVMSAHAQKSPEKSAYESATDGRGRSGGRSTLASTDHMCLNRRTSTCCQGSPRRQWPPLPPQLSPRRNQRTRSALLLPAPCPQGIWCTS